VRTLKLLINGEEKTFTIPFVNGMVWRKFLEIKSKVDMKNLKPEDIDQLVELAVYAFGNRFTGDQFYEGIPHDKVLIRVDELFLPSDQSDEEGAEGNEKK
jgi:hypothetical protein